MKYLVRAVLLSLALVAFGLLVGWHPAWVALFAWLGFSAAVGASLLREAYPPTSGADRDWSARSPANANRPG